MQTIHADKLEIQVSNLKDKLEEVKAKNRELKVDLHTLPQRHHHRHTESDFESDSSHLQQMPCCCHQCHDNPPSPSTQMDGAISDVHAAGSPFITSPETN
jgi:hypothetical protein